MVEEMFGCYGGYDVLAMEMLSQYRWNFPFSMGWMGQ